MTVRDLIKFLIASDMEARVYMCPTLKPVDHVEYIDDAHPRVGKYVVLHDDAMKENDSAA